jgi:hypothetical protein
MEGNSRDIVGGTVADFAWKEGGTAPESQG